MCCSLSPSSQRMVFGEITLIQGGQETLEDPEKPWIFFAPGKLPWEALRLQPAPEKFCSEADFLCSNIWPCSAVTLLHPVTQLKLIYEVSGGRTAYRVSCGKQPHFPTTETKFHVKHKMESGWVQAENLYVIIIFFENIAENPLENPEILVEYPLESPGKGSCDCWQSVSPPITL